MNRPIQNQPDLAGQSEEGSGRRVLTLRETAAFLNVHPNTVRSQVRRGKLPGAKIGRGWRFLEADLVAAIRARYPERPRGRLGIGGNAGPWPSGAANGFIIPGARQSAERALDALLDRPAGARATHARM
jgi:excisionase family DNA binding protein